MTDENAAMLQPFTQEDYEDIVACENISPDVKSFPDFIKKVTRNFGQNDWKRWDSSSESRLWNVYNAWMNRPVGWINVIPVVADNESNIKWTFLFPGNACIADSTSKGYVFADSGEFAGGAPGAWNMDPWLEDVDMETLPYLGHAYDDKREIYSPRAK